MDAPTPAPLPAAKTSTSTPLLPSFLLQPAAVLWLWLLPVGVMLLLNLQGYWLIEGNMDDAERDRALVVGLAGAANFVAGLILFIVTRLRRTRSDTPLPWYLLSALAPLVIQVAYLWMVMTVGDQLLPASVTVWIYPPDRFFFNQFSFAMVPLFLGILRVAGGKPTRRVGHAVAINLGLAMGAPVLFYLLIVGLPRFDDAPQLAAVVVSALLVGLGGLMFVGIVRVILVALRAMSRHGASGERVAIVLCALVLPVCGLLLNRSIPFPVTFQAWEVYALVGVTTVVLLLASWHHERWPRVSFGLLCGAFPFSLYFFVVFLPYTPLSILAVVAMGAGFLVLTPTFLFTLHVSLLHRAAESTSARVRPLHLTLIGVACGLLLPGFFIVRGLADKAALHAALDYAYAPTITGEDLNYPGSRANLRRALSSHRHYKNGIYYPLLSDFYAWLVFDDLVLPDDKLAHLEHTFFGRSEPPTKRDRFSLADDLFGPVNVRNRHRMPQAAPPPRTAAVRILGLRVRDGCADNTTATLELTLENTGSGGAEYVQTLPLSAGMFVNGFRMQVNGTWVPGRIVEKKTAHWVYTMIRDSERRDPGLLVYTGPNQLELRVFPINPDTPAKVEIDFLLPGAHPNESVIPQTSDPAVAVAHLGTRLAIHRTDDERGTFIAGGLAQANLPRVERGAALHLIVDRSEENGFDGALESVLPQLRQQFPTPAVTGITLANYQVVDLEPPYDEALRLDPATLDRTLATRGGFALDLALAHAIDVARARTLDGAGQSGSVPPRSVFVIISKSARPRPLELRVTTAWTDLLPGLELHECGADGTFATLSGARVATTPLLRLGSSIRPLLAEHALRFPATAHDVPLEYWAPDETAWRPVPAVRRVNADTEWSRAAGLSLLHQDYARSPGNAEVGLPALVQASRESGVLLPATSYIVVENEAQWRMLDRAEAQKLGQNDALEFLETPAPPALLIAAGFLAWLGWQTWRRRGRCVNA